MSSILRALKKLENDTTASPGIPIGPGTGGTGSRHRKGQFLLKSLFVLILIFGGAAGGIFLYSKPIHKISSQPAPVVKKAEAVAGLKNNVPQNPVVHEPSGLKSGTLMKAENKSGMQITPVTNQPGQVVAEEESNLNHTESPPANKEMPENAPPNALKTPAEAQPNPPQPQFHEPSKSENLPEIDESAGLELQAISWGTDPKTRLAVISGQLCHENESVNGYVVKQINPDDVVVSNGSVTGKLVLKIR